MSEQKVALITGVTGQDGSYLAELLLEKGYRVVGTDRRKDDDTFWRLKSLGIDQEVETTFMDLLDMPNIFNVLREFQPDEVYNLAAQSAVGTSFKAPYLTSDINSMGVLRLLDGIRTILPEAHFYQASSSEMFGKVQETPQRETTSFYPRSPYGDTDAFAQAVLKIIKDDSLRSELEKNGLEWAQSLTWDSAATQTMKNIDTYYAGVKK